VATESSSKDYVQRASEVAIHIGLLALLSTACLLILLPFVPLVAWGIIIAIAVYPGYRKFQSLLGGNGTLAAVLGTLLFLAAMLVPVYLLAGTTIDGVQALTAHFKEGSISIPPPPPSVATWPLIGPPLSRTWTMASTNLSGLVEGFGPQIKDVVTGLLAATAGIGAAILQFILSLVLAGVLLANTSACIEVSHSLANRLFGDRGPEFEDLAGSTIRSVTNGILGVALIQTVLAGLGFLIGGLPGAGLWTLIFLFGAVLQVGVVVLIPAVIYMFVIASTT
jgi:predicted PurR-regulated permease PerM